MPFHIFFSTWIGSSFDVLSFTKGAKDALLAIGAVLAFTSTFNLAWLKQLIKDRLVQLILAYAALTFLLALIKPNDIGPEILAVVYNTRFLLFFLYAYSLTRLFDNKHLLKRSAQIVLASGLVVLLFGIIQYTLLPNDALVHLGYIRENGVLPAFFIDDKPDLERAMSTLRDPNSFGSYIIVIGTIAAALYKKAKKPEYKRAIIGFLLLCILCLWFSFSRSAWLGALVAAFALAFIWQNEQPDKKVIKKTAILFAVIVLISGTGLLAFRNSYSVKNIVFHADESTVLEDPNELRVRFIRESAEEIISEPMGHGPGTAGLVSIQNKKEGTVLNENYYLQIAHEAGILGLALFLAIILVVGQRLFMLSKESLLALGLVAGFAGLAFTNLLVHIWSNEAVAYTWWGLAGLVLAKRKTLV